MSTLNTISIQMEQLRHFNEALKKMEPSQIILWARSTFPRLFHLTSFGYTGIAIIDVISNLHYDAQSPINIIFIDTLHHFQETYDFINDTQEKYKLSIHTYYPLFATTQSEFCQRYGKDLWKQNRQFYDFLVKIEPTYRAYKELNVATVLTGRRRSQGGDRKNLDIIEIEDDTNIIKINPFCWWDFEHIKEYVYKQNIPYNSLSEVGYASIGDWHSSFPIEDGEAERSGRWKGEEKTECGMHRQAKLYN